MDADLDTLATALYVRTDDLLKASPERAPWRATVGIKPQISDAELITLAVMAALLRFTSEARWLRHGITHPVMLRLGQTKPEPSPGREFVDTGIELIAEKSITAVEGERATGDQLV